MSALARPRLQTSSLASAEPFGASECPASLERTVAAALVPFRRRIEALERELDELRALICPPPPAAAGCDRLRQACADLAIPVSVDGWIAERDVGRLINRSAGTIRNWRRGERPLPFRRLGNRTEYELTELQAFLESRGES